MIKRILLGLGGMPHTAIAIRRAVDIAKRFDSQITGVTMLNLDSLKKNRCCAEKNDARHQ